MAIILEQSNDQFTRSLRVTPNVELRAITLSHCQARGLQQRQAATLPITVDLNYNASSTNIESGILHISLDFAVIALDKSESEQDPKVVFNVGCRLEATYQVLNDLNIPQEDAEAFASGNAVFNCWPYFREFVQNLSGRMGLQMPPIPFLRLQVKQDAESEKPS